MQGTGSKRAVPTPESIPPKIARPLGSAQIPNAIPLCRREDLKIDDIELRDEKRQGILAMRPNQDKRLAAAESYIRDALIKEGLMPADLSGEYVELILADCMVEKL